MTRRPIPALLSGPDAMIWSLDSLGTSYDIASFRVTTYTYVPAA